MLCAKKLEKWTVKNNHSTLGFHTLIQQKIVNNAYFIFGMQKYNSNKLP